MSRGDLPEDMAAEYETQRKAFDSLQKLTASLAETLGLDMPVLESTSLTRLKGSVKVISTNVSRASHLLSRFLNLLQSFPSITPPALLHRFLQAAMVSTSTKKAVQHFRTQHQDTGSRVCLLHSYVSHSYGHCIMNFSTVCPFSVELSWPR